MPYLNLDPDFFSHPKTIRLCGAIGPEAAIYPLRLWAYCAKFHPENGDLKGYSESEIERVMDWRGKPGELISAMVRVSMLEACGKDYMVHDWKEHEGHLEAYRIRGKLAAESRWAKLRKKQKENATSNATSIPEAMPQPTNQPAIQPDKKDIVQKSRSSFTAPTLEQVKTYCKERGNTVDPERFISHYESNGWKVGKNKMVSFEAAIRTWEKNQKGESHATDRGNTKTSQRQRLDADAKRILDDRREAEANREAV